MSHINIHLPRPPSVLLGHLLYVGIQDSVNLCVAVQVFSLLLCALSALSPYYKVYTLRHMSAYDLCALMCISVCYIFCVSHCVCVCVCLCCVRGREVYPAEQRGARERAVYFTTKSIAKWKRWEKLSCQSESGLGCMCWYVWVLVCVCVCVCEQIRSPWPHYWSLIMTLMST